MTEDLSWPHIGFSIWTAQRWIVAAQPGHGLDWAPRGGLRSRPKIAFAIGDPNLGQQLVLLCIFVFMVFYFFPSNEILPLVGRPESTLNGRPDWLCRQFGLDCLNSTNNKDYHAFLCSWSLIFFPAIKYCFWLVHQNQLWTNNLTGFALCLVWSV